MSVMDDSGIAEFNGWSPTEEVLDAFWEEGTGPPAGKDSSAGKWRSRKSSSLSSCSSVPTVKKRTSAVLEDFTSVQDTEEVTPETSVKRRKLNATDAEAAKPKRPSPGNLQDTPSAVQGEAILLCTEEENDAFFAWKPLSISTVPDRERVKKAFLTDHMGFFNSITDTYLHRRSTEISYHPIDCLSNQPQITCSMRALLVDWLTKVQKQLQFCLSTLFQAVNIIDRFLVSTPISRDCFQLLGITALLIAGKKEEVCPADISELVRLCCDTYNKEQVRQLELLVLQRLEWRLLAPTSHFFLEYHAAERIHNATLTSVTVDQCRQTRALGRYVLELSLQDYSLCQYPPSLLAVLTLEIADEILSHSTRLGSVSAGGYSTATVDECLQDLRMLTNTILANCDIDDICSRYSCLHDCEDY